MNQEFFDLIKQYQLSDQATKYKILQGMENTSTLIKLIDQDFLLVFKELISSNEYNSVMFALKIYQILLDRNDILVLNEAFKIQFLQLLKFQDKRVQDLTIQILSQLQLNTNYKDMMLNIFNDLRVELDIQIKPTSEEFKTGYVSNEQLLETLFQLPLCTGQNKIKIIEPMFQCSYAYSHDNNILIQGLLVAFQTLATNYTFDQLSFQLIEKSFNHSNKYSRKSAIDLCVGAFQKNHDSRLLIYIQKGLFDESLEVRNAALQLFPTIQIKSLPEQLQLIIKQEFCIGLFLNSHMENLMEISAKICQNIYQQSDNESPLFWVADFIKMYCLKDLLNACFQGSVSRYYQIRSCAIFTLQSITQFVKKDQHLLGDIQYVSRCMINNGFFESDPQVRQTALCALYNLVKFYQLPQPIIDSILECAVFHLSDAPPGCKENAAKILAQLYSKEHKYFELLNDKFILMSNRTLVITDFIGEQQQLQDEQINNFIQQQGGKEKVINKHITQLNLGMSFIFKYISEYNKDQLSEEIQQHLRVLLKNITEILRQNYIYNDGLQEFKFATFITIAESLPNLKSIKRFPIRIIEESEYLMTLAKDVKNHPKLTEVLSLIAKTVGDTILKGRLENL